jgi:hypothetical protein
MTFQRSMRARAASAVLAASLLALAGCGGQGDETMSENHSSAADGAGGDCAWTGGHLPVATDLEHRLASYAPTELSPDLDHLDATQTAVLEKLVEASKIMNEIFAAQATPCREALEARIAELPAEAQEGVRRYFRINFGPWDRRLHHEPFFGAWAHPEGANYYPLNLTEAEKEAISDPEGGFNGLFTMVRRDAHGALKAVPYSEHFAAELTRAAALLREASDLTQNASLKAFLSARADAFLDDDYYQSDMLWMDLDSTVEITIGPYETYEDGLFGYKAAFESFVTVTDPVESGRLTGFKHELPWLEASLPIPDVHKNPNRGTDSPIRVVDEVYSAGDTRAGVQTIAFNLPNDERVREAKGSKKVLLRNVMKAKFEQILVPIAGVLVAEEQLPYLSAESFFLHTLWHEMSHGLGPGKITLNGRETEVRLELKDTYSTMEEAKADAMGEWTIFVLARAGKGGFTEAMLQEQAVTYLAGLFRSVRFGIGEAHGQANAIQYNYLMEKGAIAHDPQTGRFSVDVAAFETAITQMVADICILQAEGDYGGSRAFIDKYGDMAPVLEGALARLSDIPVDVEPLFPRYE